MKFNPEKLRQIRESQGFTQRKLARLAKLSPAYISDLERGKTYPSIPTLEFLAEIFKVPISYFFEGSEQSEPKAETQEASYPDIETYLQKILSGEIPIHFQGVDRLTPELEEDIRTVLKVALSHIQLQKERTTKKAGADVKEAMKWEENHQGRTDDVCSPKEFILASAQSSQPLVCSARKSSQIALASVC
jgi:transcriptional regulator with XRE-family HTH domain